MPLLRRWMSQGGRAPRPTPAGPVKPRASGARADLQHRRSVGDAEPVNADQFEHRAQCRGQLLEPSVQLTCLLRRVDALHGPLQRICLEHSPAFKATNRAGLTDSASVLHCHHVASNPEDPGARWPGAGAVTRSGLDRGQKDVGGQVGCCVRVVNSAGDKPLYRFEMLAIEHLETIRVRPDRSDALVAVHTHPLPRVPSALHEAPYKWADPQQKTLGTRARNAAGPIVRTSVNRVAAMSRAFPGLPDRPLRLRAARARRLRRCGGRG
jgi:hypothetical protein